MITAISPEAAALHTEWRRAIDRLRLRDNAANSAAEQQAYDDLIEYLEANDLNYSQYDPRHA